MLFSWAQERLIDSLSKKINQVYRVCIGDAEVGSLNAVQKLVKVESRLVELSDLIESIPKENVEAIERIKQKERRQKYGDTLLSIANGLGGCFCVTPPHLPTPVSNLYMASIATGGAGSTHAHLPREYSWEMTVIVTTGNEHSEPKELGK